MSKNTIITHTKGIGRNGYRDGFIEGAPFGPYEPDKVKVKITRVMKKPPKEKYLGRVTWKEVRASGKL